MYFKEECEKCLCENCKNKNKCGSCMDCSIDGHTFQCSEKEIEVNE